MPDQQQKKCLTCSERYKPHFQVSLLQLFSMVNQTLSVVPLYTVAMTQFSSLLLAVDASPYAEVATRYAALLSERLRVPLRAVHVIDLRAVTSPSELGVGMGDPVLSTPYFDTELQEVMEKRAEEVRVKTQALLNQLGVSAEVELPTGPIENEILDRAAGETLIVIGKEGESAELESPRLGSVAEHLVRRAEGAVLLVPQNFTEPRRLVLGYDGSDGAEGALTYTLALAKPTQLPVLALNVQDDEETAKAPLERAVKHAARDGVDLRAEVLQGDPTEAMVGATQAGDIIAIGAFETGRLAEFFRGSTTRDVVLQATGPVLLHH